MKLLTINTHSLLEEEYDRKCREFVRGILKHYPDVIAMQEVNQTLGEEIVDNQSFIGTVPLRKDNHALRIMEMLRENGADYNMVWAGIKQGYGKFEEGLAFLTKQPFCDTKTFQISACEEFSNWKTRKGLLLKCGNDYFCNLHFGWWDDSEEPFLKQWEKVNNKLQPYNNVFLLGDFNSASHVRGEGYDLVCSCGWYDTYQEAIIKDEGYTVKGKIAGWKEVDSENKMRIDYIFSKNKEIVVSSVRLFNNINGEEISDHYGVLVEIERENKLL